MTLQRDWDTSVDVLCWTGTKTYEIRITSSDMYRRFESPQMVTCRSFFAGFYEPVAMVDERTDVQST